MEHAPFARNFTISTGVHILLILAVIITSFFLRPKKKKPKNEIITYVNFQAPAPAMSDVRPVKEFTPPEAAPPPPPPEPAPTIKPPKPPEPEPIKPKPKPKPKPEFEKSKTRVKRPDQKPEKPPKPRLTEEQIREQLAAAALASSGNPSDFPGWYYALVKQAMYEAWDRPGAGDVEDGLSARVRIRVEKDGRITERSLERASGNAAMDQSVMAAAASVAKLQALPGDFSGTFKEITVDFVLRL